ncbi:beta/alpha barrel domain-containing protein [Sphingobacterium griseoflavum]|uniref:Hydroxymethylglutaryl-CoA lyase n=1 Tax=Sphingobacterium griseoflavum TaxID=1474952 RepID=A0ABQ3HUN1_9SPHI|nr:hydroxymethylglutaryl-CoA lyase [Sphingobacterium griseoflavum]GHE29436.1 hydroxymethylglutaryl-CoA lyase [Sphingobacterium griseoflavum]
MPNEPNTVLVDCPRDAIQGIKTFIPTEKKIAYINSLLQRDLFGYIDFGSFVSPKAVPQLADTASVLEGLENKGSTKLIAIIANEKGAVRGREFSQIDYLGFPFSMSDTFQRRNTNRSIEEAYESILACQDILSKGSVELMIYLSMAFGNPYGDHWHPDIVLEWVERLVGIGIRKFSIADTTSSATAERIRQLFSLLYREYPDIEWSIHLHSRTAGALEKVDAAYSVGCRIFEGAVMGYGGCPFAQDDLVGNIPTELLLRRFKGIDDAVTQDLKENFQKLIKNVDI